MRKKKVVVIDLVGEKRFGCRVSGKYGTTDFGNLGPTMELLEGPARGTQGWLDKILDCQSQREKPPAALVKGGFFAPFLASEAKGVTQMGVSPFGGMAIRAYEFTLRETAARYAFLAEKNGIKNMAGLLTQLSGQAVPVG